MGTARIPTQGSCLPLVTMSADSPAKSTVLPLTPILEVGFKAIEATMG